MHKQEKQRKTNDKYQNEWKQWCQLEIFLNGNEKAISSVSVWSNVEHFHAIESTDQLIQFLVSIFFSNFLLLHSIYDEMSICTIEKYSSLVEQQIELHW